MCRVLNKKEVLAILILCLIFIGYMIPDVFNTGCCGPDGSWRDFLAYASDHGVKYGKDLVFTYGPLNQLYTHQYSSGWIIYTLLMLLMNLVFLLVVVDVCGLYKAIIYLGLTFIVVPHNNAFPDDIFFIMNALFVYWILFKNENPRLLFLVVISVAIFANVKFSYVIAAILPLSALCYRRKYFYAINCIIIFLAIWFISQRNILGLYDYFRYSWDIADGYNLAMQNYFSSTYDYKNLNGYFVVIIYLISGLIAYAISNKKIVMIWLYLVSFFIYKESVVRADSHTVYLAIFNLNILIFLMLSYPKSSKLAKALTLLSAIISVYIINNVLGLHVNYPTFYKNYFTANESEVKVLSGIQELYQFPKLNGCSDVYPWDSVALIASGNNICMRPIFQSYSAYTDKLLNLNAQHLLIKNAPDNIFWTVSAYDLRYPTSEDSLSWPIIFTKYTLEQPIYTSDFIYMKTSYFTLNNDDYVILKKNTLSNNFLLNSIFTKTNLNLGSDIVLPKHKLIWASIDIKPTIWEKLIALLYKPNQLNMIVTYENGKRDLYQIRPSMAKYGFILSPNLASTDDFVKLYFTNGKVEQALWDENRIKSVTVDTVNGKFRSMYTIESFVVSEIQFKQPLNYNKKIFSPMAKIPIYKDNLTINGALEKYQVTSSKFAYLYGLGFNDHYAALDFNKFIVYKSNNQEYWFNATPVFRYGINEYFKPVHDQSVSGFKAWINQNTIKPGTYNVYEYIINKKNADSGKMLLQKNIKIN